MKKVTENEYDNILEKWFLGRLRRATVTSQNDVDTQTRVSAFNYYDDTGLLSDEIIEPDNAEFTLTTHYDHDDFGNVKRTTVSGGNISSRSSEKTYDAFGRFTVGVKNALNHTETRVFDARFGVATQLTGPNKLSTNWEIDDFGRPTLERRADGTETSTVYQWCANDTQSCTANSGADPAGDCPQYGIYSVTTTTSGQAPTTVYYDSLKRAIRTKTFGPDKRAIYKDTVYNEIGHTEKVSRNYHFDGSIYWTRFEYDELDRVVNEISPNGARSETIYQGLTTIEINSKSQTATRVFNVQGKLRQARNGIYTILTIPLDKETANYRYDSNGNLLELTDQAGNVTTMKYDIRGRKIEMTEPNMGRWTYSYNALGELISQTDAKHQTVTMTYDLLGRMVNRDEIEGLSTWEFDAAQGKGVGKLAKVAGANGYQRVLVYDNLGRLESTTTTIDNEDYTQRLAYDNLGRINVREYPTGFRVQNEFDDNGFLSEVRDADTDELFWRMEAMDEHGNITRSSLGNGVTTLKTFDPINNFLEGVVTGLGTGSEVQLLSYKYDTLGNLEQRKDQNQGVKEDFGYDRLNRLISATFDGIGTKNYQYDSVGNIKLKSDVGSYEYGLNAGPHSVTKAGQYTYTYDDNGSLIEGGGRTVKWTSFNKPSEITKDSTKISFDYNPDHTRIVQRAASKTTIYLNPRLAPGMRYEKEIQATSVKHIHYIYAGGGTVAMYNLYDNGSKTTRYLHKDHIDSIDAITDEMGQVVERRSYTPFGKRRQPGSQTMAFG